MTGDERQMMIDDPSGDDDNDDVPTPAKTTVKAPVKRGRKPS
jgi:hypothetical protein